MKRSAFMCVSMVMLASVGFAATKTVTWSLPADWADEVAYPEVQGYRAIVGGCELRARAGLGKVGEPDLPYYLINIALPDNGTFGSASAEVEWEKVDFGGVLPFPILEPVPSGSDTSMPPLSDAYKRTYPAAVAKAKYLEICSGVRMMPITVTPFKWEGATKTLYRAKSLTVKATFDAPASRRLSLASASSQSLQTAPASLRSMALSMTVNPDDATTASPAFRLSAAASDVPTEVLASQGNDLTADFIILSPHKFVDLWKDYATFRKGTQLGAPHEFAVVDTQKIYEQFTDEHDDALKIHHYLEGIYNLGHVKYVLLGAAAKRYKYDPETMIPTRYVVAGGGLNQISDEYYGCMDRLPIDSGVEVWDYDGDGYYMGHRNVNGSYTHDSPAYIDFKQDIIVFRFSLMERMVDSGLDLTAAQVIDNFKKKVTYLESDAYANKFDYCLSGSTVFGTVYRGGTGDTRGMTELTTRERKFFDGNRNTFDPEHSTSASDSELMPRDRHWEFLSCLRGSRKVVQYNSTQSNATYADMYDSSGAVFNIWAHGWARGCPPGDGSSIMKMKGYYTFFITPIPCESGMMDYCAGCGITNTISFGESSVLSPHGGLASFANTRLGWVAGYKTSSNHGGYSTLIEHYLFRCLSGVTRFDETGQYELMDAGEAQMYAKNHYTDNYSSIMWGLAGVQVTGWGDPLARLPIQHARIWDGNAKTTGWNTNDANWKIAGGNDHAALDQSRDIVLPLKGGGSKTFDVDGYFTTSGFHVSQDEGATLEIAGTNGTFKVFREAVITNGNLRWTAAGGIGRNGIKFAGSERGDIELPGNAERYFGDNFVHVGKISVSGGNVTIDTPRGAQFGDGNALDFQEVEFVAENAADVTEWNTLRSREPGIFKADKHLRVVNSKLKLETYNIGGSGSGNWQKPLVYATNSTVRVRANPRWFEGTREEYFVRPTYLHDSVLEGCFEMFGFGPDATTGYDLYVSGKCKIAGDADIKLNGELRVHFLGADAELEIANTLCDGLAAGSVRFIGTGTVKVTATQDFTGTMTASDGVTIRCAIPNAISGGLLVENGGKLVLDSIPLAEISSLVVNAGGGLYLPKTTAKGIYQLVDTTTCAIELKSGYKLYDNTKEPPEEITGELTDGYIIQTGNILYWNVQSGTWNKSDTSVWRGGKAYSDGLPLAFEDIGGAAEIDVTVGEDVAPGFMDFRNTVGRYVFAGGHAISLGSLALTKNVAFRSPLHVAGSLRVLGGSTEIASVDAPLVEVAGGGELRITGEATVTTQKIRKVRFEFSETYTAGNRAAIQELWLYSAKGVLRLPIGTVIKDIAGQTVNVIGWKDGDTGLVLSGATGDEQLGALVDGKYQSGNNKWWASKSDSPTWFEITFPETVDPLTGYCFCTADSGGRNPASWVAYTSIDGTHWAKAAEQVDYRWGGTRNWMNNGKPFDFVNANGFLTAKDGGTLVADGISHVNLEFEAGATLAITNDCCISNAQGYAKLTLPDGDTVKVDFSRAKSSAEAFPIVRGFNITAEQFAKFECVQDTAMLKLKDGDIYAATAGIMVPPYTATVSSGSKWSDIEWSDKYNTKFNMGSANIKADGEATLTVNGTVAMVNDVVGTIAKLTVKGSGNLSISTDEAGVVFEPAVLDDSAHTGTLVWDQPIGSAAVIAGADTQIGGGEPGKGLLTVAANKKVTLLSGVTFANTSIDAAGWLRYAGKRTGFEIEGMPDAIYSFEDAGLTGIYTFPNKTIRSQAGDKAVFESTNISYYARSQLNFDIQGGLVEFDVHGPMMSFGRTGVGSATKFAMSGGTFRCKTEQSETNGGLLLGYEGGTGDGCEISIKPTDGLFEVPNSFVNFFYPTIFHLTGNARLRGKGFISTQNPGTIILGTNLTAIANASVLEIGSLGFRNNAAAVTLFRNSSVLGYEDGAYLEQDITVSGNNNAEYCVTVAATNGTTFTLRDMAFSFYRGTEAVIFGNKAKSWDGTIKIDTLASLPPRYRINAGMLDLGTVGCSDTATLVSAPENGATVRVVIARDDYESGAAVDVLRCASWASDRTDAQIREFLKLYTVDKDGAVVAVSGGTLKYLNGLINFIPAGGAGYVFPLSATVTANADWKALDWKDRNGIAYTNDWTKVRSAELVCNGNYTVTMDKAITLEKYLKTVTASGKTLTIEEAVGKELTVAQVDDSGSAGTTILHITLGVGATVKAGKNLELKGAADETTEHGTIQIPSGGTATIRNGLWNGDVEMTDSTSKLSFTSDTTYTTVPSSIGKPTVGTITYYTAMAPSDGIVQFGSDSHTAADGTFNTRNAGFTCKRFVTGIGNGTIQKFVFYSSGSTITVTPESDDDEIVLAQDPGSSVTLSTQGAIYAPDALMWLGKGGSASLHMFSDISVKGLVNDRENATSSEFLLYGNTMTIGSDGINLVSDVTEPFYCSGAIRARESATVHVEPYIGCCIGMKLIADEGVTMTVDSPIASTYRYSSGQPFAVIGPGLVVMTQPVTTEGTVTLTNVVCRLTRPELLNTSKVVFEAGSTMEVVITKAQALATDAIKLYATDATADAAGGKTTMLVEGTFDSVDGTFTKKGDYIYFTPLAFSGAYAETTSDGDVNWTDLNWHDKSGQAVDPAVWSGTVGTITLSNAFNAVVCFDGSCTVSELVLVNDGALSFAGNGEMATYKIDDSISKGRTVIGAFVKSLGSVVAGADTTMTERGDGNVTVDTGRRVTIPGWTTPANVQGAGVVALDMGSRDAAVATYWSKDAGITGTNQIVCGTWEFTASSQYPGSKNLLVSGTNAVLRLATSTDVTYGAGGSGSLTVEEGGEFQVRKRDTFNRALCLRNGGKLLMNNDNNDNSGRSFDMFTSATLKVEGAEPSVIGGENATADSYGNPINTSGIIAIRRNNFTIDVAKNSALKCYSKWATAYGHGGSFIKSGSGAFEQYRESSSALPFVVQQGILRLVNSGTVTTGGITVNYGALEVVTSNGYSKAMANVISGGSGMVIKSGPGTLTLSAANTFGGGLSVKGGTLKLGHAAAMSVGAVTVDDGATLDIATHRPANAIKLDGLLKATVTQSEKDGEQWLTLCTMANDSTFTLANLTVYDTNGTTPLTDAETRITDDKEVQVKCQAYKMPIVLDAYSAVNADWTQTSWKDANSTVIPPEKWSGLYGRTNLAVEVYAHNGNAVTLGVCDDVEVASFYVSDDTGKVTLRDADGENAHTWKATSTTLGGTLQVYDKVNLGMVSGGGTLIATNFIPAYAGLDDATKWTGTLRLWNVTATALDLAQIANAQSQVTFDDVEVATAVTIPAAYTIAVAEGSGFIAPALTVNGAVHLAAGSVKPFAGDVSFAAGAKLYVTMASYAPSIPLTDGTLEMPNGVSVYINGVERPAGTWAVSNGAIKLPFTGPFRATVTQSAEWTALEWTDSSTPPVAVHPGFWATSTSADNVELTVNAGATLTASSAITVGSVKVTGSGAVALPAGNFTMGNLLGSGTVSYAAWPTCTGLKDGTKWTGALKLIGKLDGGGKTLADYGNDQSTIEIAGTLSGYLAKAGSCSLSILLTGTLTFSNGYSNDGGYTFNGALSGDGKITTSGAQSDVIKFLGGVSGFTGSVQVGGDHCIAFGDHADTDTTKGQIIVNQDVAIAAGKQWSAANGIVVRDGRTLAMTPGTTPVSGNVTFEGASTLRLLADGTAESYAVATGTLALGDSTVVRFGDAVASRSEWFVVGGRLVRPTDITVSPEGTSLAGHDGHPIAVTGVAGGYAMVDAAISPLTLIAKGDALTIKYSGCGSIALAGGLVAGDTDVSLDASGMDGTELAKNAVRGAPYSHWLVKGSIGGTVAVTQLPAMPAGYKVESQILTDYGVRLIVKAPVEAMFGVISLNLHNGVALSAAGDHGLYPDALANWGNLQATANSQALVSNVTFTIGNNASGYNISSYADEIYNRYMDDKTDVTRTIAIGAVPFEKYRVLVYYSTDTANYQFQPLVVNDGTADECYAGETQLQDVASHTVKGRNATWGHSGPDQGMNAINEGVNLLVTDVYAAEDLTLKFTRKGNPRATPCAIQIVKVGEIAVPTTPEEPFALAFSGAAGMTDWKSAAWMGDNGVAVPSTSWDSPVGEAKIVVEDDGSATLIASSSAEVDSLSVTNAGSLAVGGSLSVTTLDDSGSTGATTVDATVADVAAGSDTTVATFTGTATVAAGKQLTVLNGSGGSAAGDGTVVVKAGTLSVAIGSSLALEFADDATLNLTGALAEGGTFPFASSMTGKPTVTLNGGDLPGYCKIEGNSIVVTPEKRAWANPVIGGDPVNFSYSFVGSSDANWTTIGNWREYGTITWNAMTGTAPMLKGSNRWDPTVIDGSLVADEAHKTITLSGTSMEGWTPRLALFNGVDVTIGNMVKLQSQGNGEKWIWVDETSRLTVSHIDSGNFSHDLKLYVAGTNGVTFAQAIPKDGTAFEYYLAAGGTVRYEAALAKCTHAIRQFKLAMGKPSAYKIIKERTLVTYPSASVSFATNSIAATADGGVAPSNLGRVPTLEDAVGAYCVVKGETALVVRYVDYSPFCTNLEDNAEIAISTINALAATAGGEPYHVVLGKGVAMVFDAELASNVEIDSGKMTADSTFVKKGSGTLTLDGAHAFAGTFDVREGVMTIPVNVLANALIVSGGILNLNIPGGLVAGTTYTITTGAMTGIARDVLTVNGEALPAGWKIKDGQLSKIEWTYPLALAPTGDFTTATAEWTDSSNPVRAYTDGFDDLVDSVQIDGYAMTGMTYWTNDVSTLHVGTLSLAYIGAADIHIVNANGCVVVADVIDVSGYIPAMGYTTNTEAVHLEFATGSAAVIAGDDTWLYGDGSGAMTLAESTRVTFNPSAGTNLTYSGAIAGAGKLVKDGDGQVHISSGKACACAGGVEVRRGTLKYAVGKMASAVTLGKDGVIDLVAAVETNAYAITTGTLTLGEGTGIDNITVNGKALTGMWRLNAAGNGIEKVEEIAPEDTKEIIPATRTNDVKIVTTWTNDDTAVKLDLTPAFTLTKVEGGVKAELNPAGHVEVDGEMIEVTPELTEADDEKGIRPLVVGEDVAVGVKTIPGLVYELLRGTLPGTYDWKNPAAHERANGPRTQLVDEDKPADRAFYIIRVVR